MKRVQQGFTLIELMIVVAIVGILAAIALPAYQDYIVRSKMSEVEAAIAACKTSVAEYAATKGNLPANASQAGCSAVGSQYVASGGGWTAANTIVYTDIIPNVNPHCKLTLTPGPLVSGGIASWAGSETGGCPAKYVPAAFR